MSEDQFIVTEGTVSNRNSARTLFRFIGSLTLLRKTWPIAAFLVLIATASPQLFLWLTGEFSQCSDFANCNPRIPYLGYSLHLTPAFLCWVAATSTFFRLASWAACEITGQWSVQDIHRAMVLSVSNVRTTFFDENPSSRLINRFVRDFESLRGGVIRVSDTFHSLLEILCIAALICLAHPIGALLVVPALAAFFYLQQQVAPMLQRSATLKSARLSDVLHRETDLIEGARTFLLYGKQRALVQRLQGALERFVQIHLSRAQIEAWGRFWSNSITSVYGFLTLAIVAAAQHYGTLSPVIAAVIVTVIFRMAPVFGWFTWVSTYLVESIATARRVFEFVDLPNEVTEERAEPAALTAQTPERRLDGAIEFDGYTMSYRKSSPEILNGLTVSIPAGKRVGIVGRTGAGKTSLVQSLYRMVYVHSGDIRIGGSSIFSYPIDFIRSHFGVVPQDPYLFEGTIGSNLDRAGTIPSGTMTDALARVGLPLALDYRIEEGGKNLSLGERQLLCLARVILLDRPIVLMDEPTSSVDTITDKRIQDLLTSELSGKTVITIAHRLETLSRYDLVIELKDGRVVRQGPPEELLHTLSAGDVA